MDKGHFPIVFSFFIEKYTNIGPIFLMFNINISMMERTLVVVLKRERKGKRTDRKENNSVIR